MKGPLPPKYFPEVFKFYLRYEFFPRDLSFLLIAIAANWSGLYRPLAYFFRVGPEYARATAAHEAGAARYEAETFGLSLTVVLFVLTWIVWSEWLGWRYSRAMQKLMDAQASEPGTSEA